MERINQLDEKLKMEVGEKIRQQYSETDKACDQVKLKEHFGFSNQQMLIFNASFAYFILSKQALEASRLSRLPEIQALLNVPVFGHIARKIIEIDEINNHAIKRLKEVMQKRMEEAIPEESPKAGAIRNAANHLSTVYLKCKESLDLDFEEEFLGQKHYVKSKILGI